MRVALIFLSFFIILYWILQLAGINFIKPLASFFEGIKAFTHIFYNKTAQINGAAIDFSFLISALTILLFVFGLKFIIDYIEFAERKYDSICNYLKKKKEDSFNIKLEKQYLTNEYKNNKFLVLIKFNVTDLSKDKFFNKDISNGIEQKQKEILKEFSDGLEEKLKFQERFINEGILLYFYNFDNIDEILSIVKNNIKDLSLRYNEQQYRINFFIGVEVYADTEEIPLKVEKLIKLVKLGLANNIICLSTFKQRYALIKNPKYTVETQGVYTIIENEDIFALKV